METKKRNHMEFTYTFSQSISHLQRLDHTIWASEMQSKIIQWAFLWFASLLKLLDARFLQVIQLEKKRTN